MEFLTDQDTIASLEIKRGSTMIVQLDLSVAELEKLTKDAEWAAREHWRLTVQSRSQKEHDRGIFLNQLRDKLQTALRQAR